MRSGSGFVPSPRTEATPEATGILRSSVSVAAITAVARVAGFARWIVLGVTVGTTYLGNVYQTANFVPNIVFELVAGGVLSAVFVPTFVAELERSRDRGFEVASSIANAFLIVSVPLVVVGALAGRPIMTALTVGVDDPVLRAEQIELGAWFLRVFAPQIPLYVLAMLFTGILHAHGRFVLPAAAPLFSSLVVIGTYLAFQAMGPGADIGTVSDAQRWVLAGGTTAGVLVLAFSQLPGVLRLGVRWRPSLRLRDPAVRRAFRAGMWGLAFFAVTEIGLIVTLVLANRVEGGVVAFRVALAFFELPQALIGLPIAITVFPAMARAIARREEGRFASLLSDGWRAVVFFAVPAGAGLFVLATPLTDALLGAAGTQAAPDLVAVTLRWLALGVPAYALVELVIRAFYARHSTAPPVGLNAATIASYAAVAVGFTVGLGPVAAPAMRVIAAAYAGGQWVGIAVGIAILALRVSRWRARSDLAAFALAVIRSAVMAVIVWGVLGVLEAAPHAVRIVVAIVAGSATYFLMAVPSGEIGRLMRTLRGST